MQADVRSRIGGGVAVFAACLWTLCTPARAEFAIDLSHAAPGQARLHWTVPGSNHVYVLEYSGEIDGD